MGGVSKDYLDTLIRGVMKIDLSEITKAERAAIYELIDKLRELWATNQQLMTKDEKHWIDLEDLLINWDIK